MFLQESLEGVRPSCFVQISYDCDGGFERCGKRWSLKLKDAQKNFEANGGKHICRQCLLKNNNPAKRKDVQEKMKKTSLERYGTTCHLNTPEKNRRPSREDVRYRGIDQGNCSETASNEPREVWRRSPHEGRGC